MNNLIKTVLFIVTLFVAGCSSNLDNSIELGHGFSIKENSLYHDSNQYKIEYENVEINNLMPISPNFLKDENAIYRLVSGPDYASYKMLTTIEEADPETFKVISKSNDSYILDKNNVYFYGSIIEDADVNTFKLLDFGYAKDGQSIFINGDSLNLKHIDVESFELLNNYYSKDKNAVYFALGEYIWSIQEVENANLETFEIIDGKDFYAKDNNNCYYQGEISSCGNNTVFVESDCFNLFKDNDSGLIYSNFVLLEEADGESFEEVEYEGITMFKDNNNLYILNDKPECERCGCELDLIIYKNADYNSFEFMNRYSKDKNNVYFFNGGTHAKLIEKADPQTFEFLGTDYSKDYNSVFFKDVMILNADVDSFEVLKDYYAKDTKNIYYGENTLADADPATFKIITHQLTKDDNNIYESGIKLTEKNFETWNTYEDTEFGFSFKYPGPLIIDDNAIWDKQYYNLPDNKVDGLVVPEFTFEVIDKKTNPEFDTVIFERLQLYEGSFEDYLNSKDDLIKEINYGGNTILANKNQSSAGCNYFFETSNAFVVFYTIYTCCDSEEKECFKVNGSRWGNVLLPKVLYTL